MKTATRRDQYSGLKFVVPSTRMNFVGLGPRPPLCEPIAPADGLEGSGLIRSGRLISMKLASVDMLKVGWSGGTNIPSPKNDLMFDMRMRDEADGERRMIGSGRELGLRDGTESPADGAGTIEGFLLPGFAPCWPGRLRFRSRKSSALFRTWEKSCPYHFALASYLGPREDEHEAFVTYGWLDSA